MFRDDHAWPWGVPGGAIQRQCWAALDGKPKGFCPTCQGAIRPRTAVALSDGLLMTWKFSGTPLADPFTTAGDALFTMATDSNLNKEGVRVFPVAERTEKITIIRCKMAKIYMETR